MDTRNKRSSAINVGSPWRGMLPAPDGTVAQADRQHAAFLYGGILAGSNVVTINGPLYFAAASVYLPGMMRAGVYRPGSQSGDAYMPGSMAAASYLPGAVEADVYMPGMMRAEVQQ